MIIKDIFSEESEFEKPLKKDGITDAGLAHFVDFYKKSTFDNGNMYCDISKEDLFYYIYGILQSNDYKERFADNLTKEIPRIPRVKSLYDFWRFSLAGRYLAELHVEYEKVKEYELDKKFSSVCLDKKKLYRVVKMKFGKPDDNQKSLGLKHDKTTIIYNDYITISNIPLEAYDYIVNGKSAIEWVMERQSVTTHKDSGIINDANDWANETIGDPMYPLSLLCRIVTVSMETVKIVRDLPNLDF
jgi:predicted helicase